MSLERWQQYREEVDKCSYYVPVTTAREMVKLGEQQAARLAAIVVEVQPTDVLVIGFPGPISKETAASAHHVAKQAWPHNEILITGDGATVSVLRKGEP